MKFREPAEEQSIYQILIAKGAKIVEQKKGRIPYYKGKAHGYILQSDWASKLEYNGNTFGFDIWVDVFDEAYSKPSEEEWEKLTYEKLPQYMNLKWVNNKSAYWCTDNRLDGLYYSEKGRFDLPAFNPETKQAFTDREQKALLTDWVKVIDWSKPEQHLE